MLDPLGGFDRIRELYISYLDTAFRVRRPSLTHRRHDLLRSSGTLATEPFLEPVPRYRSAEFALEDLVDLVDGNPIGHFSREGRRAFAELALSGLFPGKRGDATILRRHVFKPYQHQMEMLARGSQPGLPGIVTSGTGSGKTESFMLPILATIAAEATRWPSPKAGYLGGAWLERDAWELQVAPGRGASSTSKGPPRDCDLSDERVGRGPTHPAKKIARFPRSSRGDGPTICW
jgi:hypothetical protein